MYDNHPYYHIIDTLQRNSGGNVAKIIKMTCIFDGYGNLVGKGAAEIIKLWPHKGIISLLREIKKNRNQYTIEDLIIVIESKAKSIKSPSLIKINLIVDALGNIEEIANPEIVVIPTVESFIKAMS